MKILKLLNKKNFSILLLFFYISFYYGIARGETVDIWNLEKKKNEDNNNKILIEDGGLSDKEINKIVKEAEANEDDVNESILSIQSEKNTIEVNEDENISSKKINIVGIYDPSENDLSMGMWLNSNGKMILEVIKKIQKINLSDDATNILNIALLTNSYSPKKNITDKEFLKIKNDWLIKNNNLDLIENYVSVNKNLEDKSTLVQHYVEYYLSRSDISKACKIFDEINISNLDTYNTKFKIYCLINSNKKEEAQLNFDLLKEIGFKDKFFEKKFNYLIGYDETIDTEVSETSLLNFHLSHITNPDFKFQPKITTSKLIWKYLSSSNLLENADIIDIEDEEKIFSIEKATNDKNYNESDLFSIYERYMFNINQLLNAQDSYKILSNSQARALIYQAILINKETSERIKLIQLLKELFIKDEITNAFDVNLNKFLKGLNEEEIPLNYKNFYELNLRDNESKAKKIKFNNKIIHQSKLLNYFIEDSNKQKTEKNLESTLKKFKRDKKYYFSIKDIILIESLKADGIKISKKYENIYEKLDPNIPYDIQILIKKGESGLFLLRLVEIIGADKFTDMDSETIYFIVTALNQLGIYKLRNEILLKVLPLKV